MAVWTPRVTVAAIVNNGDQFLLVKGKVIRAYCL